MLLFHGTSVKNLQSILKSGIKPRGKKIGNWKECPSRKDRVYLTDTYAGYYAFSADEKLSVIFEIDTDYLATAKMGADEDCIGQVFAMKDKEADIHELTNNIKLEEYDHLWNITLENLGTCSYKGTIHPKAIKRYVVIDWKKANWLWLKCADTSVSIINHKFLQTEHKNIQGWMFNDNKLESMFDQIPQYAEQTKKNNLDRTALKVYTN